MTEIENADYQDTSSEDDELLDEDTTVCLFCETALQNVDEGIVHLRIEHGLDLVKLKQKFKMDQYSYIKLVNYIRKQKVDASVIDKSENVLWNDEKYLTPQKYETWLTYDFEQLNSLDGKQLVLTKDEMIEQMSKEIEAKNVLLKQASEDMHKIRTGFRRILNDSISNSSTSDNSKNAKMNNSCEESYFDSYAHFNIHHEMLSDTVRTEAYRNAFLMNKSSIKDKIVLDIGCGTAILSMFASLAGAKNVVGIDNSEIIYHAMGIIKENNFQNISLIKGKIEDTVLPEPKYDIIVSEWMGYFLFFEGMLDSIIYGRDKYLKPNGILMPNKCTISLLGYGNENRYDNYITFWDSVYGFNMSCLKAEVIQEPSFEICDPDYILTEENCIVNYDLNTVSLNYSNFDYNFNLKCIKNGVLTSFVGFFDTFFEFPVPITLSTSPKCKPTHWKQSVFYLDTKVNVTKGEIISGKISCRRNLKSVRSLNVKIEVFGKILSYHID
ncbi:uncharacterized protein LOC129608448 [Condylostylus longicornis]|uniref:uncharacterized protein LOC129608448 n=1 Tax=Condylostylus longicornis TaxID=2530218 RepID=UPI00244E385C|nr:uncharacterized protein LOC129608448 [Condylostylus longicornis]